MSSPSVKGPWTHRTLIYVFTVSLGMLIYWLLGFVLHDIGGMPGPSYAEIENRLLDTKAVAQRKDLRAQIEKINLEITGLRDRQTLVRDSTTNAQQTMSQLLEIRRLSLEKDVRFTPDEEQALVESQRLFLTNQKQYQDLNEQITQQSERLRTLEQQVRDIDSSLADQQKKVDEEFLAQSNRHNWRLAALKLAFLTPILIATGVLFLRVRTSVYAWLFYALGAAVALRVTLVMHEHFPTRYFKYILIIAALAIVLRILIYLLRAVAFPRASWLLKVYREGYESFFCPVCSYPIRRGPMRFMAWTRRSIRKRGPAAAAAQEAAGPYTCPACATRLFEKCDQCGGTRPSLLPACDSCGATR